MKKKFDIPAYEELVDMSNRRESVFSEANYFKLLRYQTSVGKELSYNRKEDYYSVIEKYLNKNLTLLEFRTQLLNMNSADLDKGYVILGNRQELEVFYLSEGSEKYYSLLSDIIDLCEDYYVIEPMPENEFYLFVDKYYRQLQEKFPFKNSATINYEHLIYRSFKFLLFSVGLEILLITFNNQNNFIK